MVEKTMILGREVSEDVPPYIIAELSANHNGNIENAYKIIDMAKRCGADAVKMQTYTPDKITLNSSKEDFVIKEGLWKGRTLYQLYDWAHTPWEWHAEMFAYAKKIGITLFSTPFDDTAVDFLEELNTPAYKIASFECTDLNLIKRVARTNKPLIISTGMANDAEIDEAVETALKFGNGKLTLLHCVSGYPSPAEEYNLRTIADMKNRFGVNVGLSDHTLSNVTAISAVAVGAVMVEKHVTLDRSGGGPDDSFSLEEDGLCELCSATKTAWQALGKTNYERTESEKGNVKFRRSLYYVRSLQLGDVITENDIRSVRPGFGLPPKYYHKLIGSKVTKSVEENTPVTLESVNLNDD
ncbi:MAG: pseudaminic acid synthase [Paracoccaceae bacterium]